jgi:putative ABC transport system permease protein
MKAAEWRIEITRAARRLKRAPGFTAVVVLTLALGVGVNTAIFTVLNAVLLQDLPYPEPDRLVRLYEGIEEWGSEVEFMRAPVVAEYRDWDVFENVATLYTYREVGADLTDGATPHRVTLLRVSAGYFETLGVAPMLGRTFQEDESFGPGEADSSTEPTERVAVLSQGLWRDRFGGDRDAVGRSLELDGESFEVVGVMPGSFRDPFGHQADVWLPQDLRPGGSNHFGNFYLSGIARLRPGLTVGAARERAGVLSEAFAEREPEMEGTTAVIRPLQADIVGETRRTMLFILATAAGLVLLTACANVANLLFTRGLAQDRALALRSALGSGRGRLIAGMLAENGLLAGLGGLLGLGLGWLGLRVLLETAPDALPMVSEVSFGTPVFLFALAVTAVALLVFGLTPALRMSRTAPADVLRSGDRASTVGRLVRRLRDGLVVIQVAAALMLVAGASRLTRSFGSLLDVPLAVEAEDVLTFEVHLPDSRYPAPADRVAFRRLLGERLSELPGVRSVGATSWLPVNGRYHSWGFGWTPSGADGEQDWNNTDVRVIEGDYFKTMGIEVIRGEAPSEVDVDSEPVAWINRWIADNIMADVDPLQQRIELSGSVRRVAGIVEDVPHTPRGDVSAKTYIPHVQADDRNWALIQTVRTDRGNAGDVLAAARAALARLDPGLVLYRPAPFTDVLSVARAQDRFATLLMSGFAGLALLLSLVGTYGILAGTVASRTREIGIRMALGADTGSVRSMIVRYAAALTLPGVLLGLAGAWLAGRWLGALLYEVEPGDPVTYAGTVVVFALVGGMAAWLPARRATRVDTVQVLTSD